MPEGKVLGLIGGSQREKVNISEYGHYGVFPDNDDTQRFHCNTSLTLKELDIWISGLKSLRSLCIYVIEKDILRITVVARPLGADTEMLTRPNEIKMDEQKN